MVFIKLCTPKGAREEADKKAEAAKRAQVGPVQKGPRKWVKKGGGGAGGGGAAGGYSRGQPPPPYSGRGDKGSGWV